MADLFAEIEQFSANIETILDGIRQTTNDPKLLKNLDKIEKWTQKIQGHAIEGYDSEPAMAGERTAVVLVQPENQNEPIRVKVFTDYEDASEEIINIYKTLAPRESRQILSQRYSSKEDQADALIGAVTLPNGAYIWSDSVTI